VPDLPGLKLVRLLGRGAFGSVYLCERGERGERGEGAGGERAAIKLARRDQSEAASRLRYEAEVMRHIGPPSVPVVLDAGVMAGGTTYLLLEFVDAPLLSDWMLDREKPRDRIAAVGAAILTALSAVHARGIIHRDLKPENIFLLGDGTQAKLIDFGLARPSAAPSPNLIRAGTVMGTAEYMSPEQCAGEANVDAATDLYSVGVILYELMTGRLPFFGAAGDVREAHRNARPPRPTLLSAMPPAVEDVLLRCLAKQPARRHSSATALRAAWLAAMAVDPAQSTRRQALPPTATETLRRRAILLFFTSQSGPAVAGEVLGRFGGHLAHFGGMQRVAVFDQSSGDQPGRRAHRAARALLDEQVTQRVRVDLAQVIIKPRPGSSPLFLSALFQDAKRYPAATEPSAIVISDEAASLVGEAADDDALATLVALPTPFATVARGDTNPLVGRDDLVDALIASVGTTIAERRPTLVTVVGASGLGKTRLCAALRERVAPVGSPSTLYFLQAPDPATGKMNSCLRMLLAQLLAVGPQAEPERFRAGLVEKLGTQLAGDLWPGLAVESGLMAAHDTAALRLAVAPGALRASAARAMGELLRRQGTDGPLLILLDDGQQADDVTLDAFEYACLDDVPAALWIGVVARPELESRRVRWGRLVRHHLRFVLDALDGDSASALCRAMLAPAEHVPDSVIERLVERAGRIPLLLVELIRGLKAGGFVRRSPTRDGWFVATDELDKVPDLPLLEWRVALELETMPIGLAAHARFLAVLGNEFGLAEVVGVFEELDQMGGTAEFPLEPEIATRQLAERGFLLLHRDGRFAFRHRLVRDALLGTTPQPLQRRLHEAAARFYARSEALRRDQYLPRLALHSARAQLRDQAFDAYLELAEGEQSRHHYLDAELFYSGAIEQIDRPDDSRGMRVYQGRAQMRYRLGRYDDALEDLERARTSPVAQADSIASVDLLLDEATILDWRNEYRDSQKRVNEAEQKAPVDAPVLLRARLLLARGRSCFRFGDPRPAVELFAQAEELAAQAGPMGYETRAVALLMLATSAVNAGQLDQAEERFNVLLPLCEEHGDLLHIAAALNNRRELWVCRRQLARALADAARCREIGRMLGQPEIEYATAFNMAELHYYAGDLTAADDHALRAAALEASASARPLALLLRARIAILGGKDAAARALLQEIERQQAAARTRHDAAGQLLESERVQLDLVALALEPFDAPAWDALVARGGVLFPWERVELLEMRGRIALRDRQLAEAIASLERALVQAGEAPHLGEDRARAALELARRAATTA
jgi:hypothetical protein